MEDIYLECISKNDKKEIEFRTTNNEIFSYQTIIYILRGYGKYFRGGRNVFAYIDNRYTPIKPTKDQKTGKWHLISKLVDNIDSNYLENVLRKC